MRRPARRLTSAHAFLRRRPAKLYKIDEAGAAEAQNVDLPTDEIENIITKDRTSVSDVVEGYFPNPAERSNRVVHDVAQSVIDEANELIGSGQLDENGLRNLLLKKLGDLKRACLTPGEVSQPAILPLPVKAPASWLNEKKAGDTPVTFIERHYQPWLGRGLTRKDLHRLDPDLYISLANWLRYNKLPPGVDLPTVKEQNDRRLAELRASMRIPDDSTDLTDIERLSWVLKSRRAHSSRKRDR